MLMLICGSVRGSWRFWDGAPSYCLSMLAMDNVNSKRHTSACFSWEILSSVNKVQQLGLMCRQLDLQMTAPLALAKS